MRTRPALLALLAITACATGPAVVTPIASLAPPGQSAAETLLAINALCSAEALGADGFAPDIKLAGGMGTGGFKVDTSIPLAQDWFNYGLALSHAFYHQDAKAAMKKAVAADPACSICSWGEAWALGPTLNYGVNEEDRKKALAAAERAKSIAKPGDQLAIRLADAMVARYAPEAAVDGKKNILGGARAGEGKTEPAFGQALAKIAADYPNTPELTVLAAHSLMMPVRGGDKSTLKQALTLIESVLKANPDDTGAIHYYIHGTEFDGRAEDAIPYANKLGKLAPLASHLVHMPAHTFFHAGRYQDAAIVNAQAIEADTKWMDLGGDPRPPMDGKFILPMYYAHNLSFGLAGAMMSGDGELALRYAEHARYAYPASGPEQRWDPTPRTWVALARYAPDRMLAVPAVTRDDPEFRAYRAYARGEALLQKGDAAGARRELALLRKETAGEEEQQVAVAVLEGRLAMAEGNTRRALQRFAAGARIQEAEMAGYMDPPAWWYPVRRSVAAVHLRTGDFVKAESEALASLKAWKQDPLALWVLGKAQAGQGRIQDAAATLERARALWRGDFDSITADVI
jgi:tetratricopeptide (TPR) repeat protein